MSKSSKAPARQRKSEIQELQFALSQSKIEVKKDAVRKIIDAMTKGKDVSMLFKNMIINMETQNMELKKLIYLYVLNYAKTKPDLVILGINSFRKDAMDKTNPFLRALAVRTMGCIRVKEIVEYLLDPLSRAIKDDDSYVRKTAAICIGKLYDLNPDIIEEQGYLKQLEKLVHDGNAMVVANSIIIQSQISQQRGETLVTLTPKIVQNLLTALQDCNEWGAIYILDAITMYSPTDSKEAEQILDRISNRLSHQNPGVVLSCVKLIMKYLDLLSNVDLIRLYQKKLAAPLISFISSRSYNEIQYVALKNINLILQKRPNILEGEIKIFYCEFNDPIYIKLQKLEILVRLANNENINKILHELKEYTLEVDVEFVKKSVKAIGRCAIKLEKSAEKCVSVLYECLKTKATYVVQETVIVIRDIFRKYPKKYEKILKDLCDNLKNLEDPEAKAAMIWIIGEYVDTIDNADQLLQSFAENFKEEQSVVQHQIVQSSLKLFLTQPNQDAYKLVSDVLKLATEECENPDLRDRALIYWRILNINPELAKQIIYTERPTISDSSYTLESEILDKLIENIGQLSSIYYKPPEKFVKRLQESENIREQEELEDIQAGEEFLQDVGNPDKDVYEGIPPQNNQQNDENNYDNNPEQLPQEIDLLGDDLPIQVNNNGNNYQNNNNNQNSGNDLISGNQGGDTRNVTINQFQRTNVTIPMTTVLDANSQSKNNNVSGLQVEACFQQEQGKIYLYMTVTNKSSNNTFSEFGVNFNANSFKLAPVSQGIGNIDLGTIAPGQSSSNRVEVNNQGVSDNQPPSDPFNVQVAMHTNLDVFIYSVPCSFNALIVPSDQLSPQQYQDFLQKMQSANDSFQSNLAGNAEGLKQLLQNNVFNFLVLRTNQQGVEMASFSSKIINGMPLLLDIILDKTNNKLNVRYSAPFPQMLGNYLQALKYIFQQ